MLFSSSFSCGEVNEIPQPVKTAYIEMVMDSTLSIAQLNINGENYTFLLDSKSPVSIIDSSTAKKKKLEVYKDENRIDSVNLVFISKCKFYIQALDETKISIKFHTGKSIDGIIGSDLLYDSNSTLVNFQKEITQNYKF